MIDPETKIIENMKVFALVIEANGTVFLSIQNASSLEEAFSLAKIEFEKTNPQLAGTNALVGGKIGLFTSKTVDEIVKEGFTKNERINEFLKKEQDNIRNFGKMLKNIKPLPLKPIETPIPPKQDAQLDPGDVKNILMGLIVKNKDIEKFQENKKMFTKSECKYIEEKIMKK